MSDTTFYFAVAPRGRPEDFRWVTSFTLVHSANLLLASPSNKYCDADIINFVLKALTRAEYETHIAFGSLPYRESDDFALYVSDTDAYLCERTQTELELHLNRVFDEQE